MPIEIDDLRELIEKVEKREADARAELADAETAEERQQIRARIDALEARNAEMEKLLAGHDEPEPEVETEPEPEPEEPEARRTRPGRRSGAAYMWTVDDDGNRVELDIPSVYSGADEPDEVELPPAAAAG
jgi:hypothetical protein